MPDSTVVGVFSHIHEAEVARSALAAAGIEGWLRDHGTIAANWMYSNALGGVKLLVRQEDAEAARQVLKTPAVIDPAEDPSHGFPDTEAAPSTRCPRCGSGDVAPIRLGVRRAFASWLLLGMPVSWVRRRMRCRTCGQAFRVPRGPVAMTLASWPIVAGTAVSLLAIPNISFAQEPIALRAADGGRVMGDLYGNGTHGVVLAPGGRFDRSSWRPQAEALATAGFRVLAIDFRAAVEARAGRHSGCLYDEACLARDVMAAVRYLQDSGATTVSVVGASLGGAGAARAAIDAAEGAIDRLVLLAHMRVAEPHRIPGRKLFLVARDDAAADGAPRLNMIRDQFERAPEPKELIVVGGAAHAQFIFAAPEGERVMREILRFLLAP